MHSPRSSARRRAGALAVALAASAWLPLGALCACATAKDSGTSEIPKKPPTYREDRAEDRVDEECPECAGPGNTTIRQEEEE